MGIEGKLMLNEPLDRQSGSAIYFALLFLFALFLNREGTWVPAGNENVYLLYLVKAWRSSFLATDWTFQESTAGHPVFNFLFGWPTRFLSVPVYGWIGRCVSWAVLFSALMRLGRHFRIPDWMVFTGLMLWLIQRQSFVANEWIIGTFEAKCVGYSCLLFALDFILSGRVVGGAILTGLAFTFHSAVGMWGGAAIGVAFASMYPIRTTVKFAVWAALFALPGLVTSLPLIFGAHPITPQEAKFMVLIEMPFHLDPMVFGKGKIVVLYLMLAFNFLHVWANRDDKKLKFLIRFQLALGAIFALGILFRVAGLFSLVQLFPFRVFAVLTMLLFFWHLAAVYYHRDKRPPTRLLIVLGFLAFFCLPSPIARLQGLAMDQLPKWKRPHDDFLTAAKWVQENTPEDTIVIAPPWRKDTFYQLQRPLIADWHVPRFTAMTEWRQRIESLVGDVSHMDPEENLAGELDARARQNYSNLTEADLKTIKAKYGGDLLITTAQYGYAPVFTAGTYTIYKLPPDADHVSK
jgi:hypothetical protein